MKASVFIKVALIDQMQQIADLGLWFHLAKLLPPGVEVLARITMRNKNEGYLLSEQNADNLAIPDWSSLIVADFYEQYFPEYGRNVAHVGSGFFSSSKPLAFLTSEPSQADNHLKPIGEKEEMVMQSFYLHVPFWFEDFKAACQKVLEKIEAGELKDIEVIKTLEL